MSDFDKEKEREKLREKYEQEEKEREATRQMSELLLQGATMTNHHCDDCGNPIFRYDGQEFCAHCQSPEQGSQAGQQGGRAGQQGDQTGRHQDQADQRAPDQGTRYADQAGQRDGERSRRPRADDPAGQRQDEEPRIEREAPPAEEESERPTDAGESGTANRSSVARDAGRPARDGPRIREDVADRRSPPRQGDRERAAGGPGETEVALERAVTKFARLAVETDDPRRARDHLAAAREAAEALSALRR